MKVETMSCALNLTSTEPLGMNTNKLLKNEAAIPTEGITRGK